MRYVTRVEKDPNNSLMDPNEWQNDLEIEEEIEESPEFPIRAILVIALLIIQYLILVVYSFTVGENIMGFLVGVFLFMSIVIGVVGGMSADEIGDSFAQGLVGMAFVVFIIGLASTMQMVMTEGNILDTMVYYITRPLMGLNRSLSAVGITAVITLINPIVPSATAKAAVLVPIVKPIANTLGISTQVACQAFLFGDGFTNMISPALGWTMGALSIAKVPYDKWVKWVIKPMLLFVLMSFAIIFILNQVCWTGV